VPDHATALAEAEWHRRRDAHTARVDRWTADRLARRRAGHTHPVDDFLFDYYAFRPGQLRQWHPGYGVALAGPSAEAFLTGPHYERTPAGVAVRLTDLTAHTDRWRRAHDLLSLTASRPPSLGCFGLHEWAMVYRLPQAEVRHTGWPLRLSPEQIAAVVDEQGLRCTHFDAYRFFTPSAAELNRTRPTASGRPDQEQPGCLHATMDLYRWAFGLHPFIASEVIADCFALARDARSLDMRAAPYDLRLLDYQPVRVETADGRAAYVAEQRVIVERGAVLRARLIGHIDALLQSSEAGARVGGAPA